MSNIITRPDAKSQGLKRYFTNKPCKRDHLSERITSTGTCIQCKRMQEQKRHAGVGGAECQARYQSNREEILVQRKEYASENKERISEYQSKYREDHTEKRLQYHKDYYAANSTHWKTVSKEHYLANIEYYTEYNTQYYIDNHEHICKWGKQYYQDNRETILEQKKIYFQEHKAEFVARSAKRRAYKLQATPGWAEYPEIAKLYIKSRELMEQTGEAYHVDHIVPLKNDYVCGLHCLANLQILTATENMQKGNKFTV